MSDRGPTADLLPDDDSFVRTAIQGLRVPTHGPDFWDQLAWRLDDAGDEMAAQGLMEDVLRSALVPDLALVEPTPHHVEDPWPESDPQAAAVPEVAEDDEIDLFAPIDEPIYEDEYEEDLADEAAAYDPAYDEPDLAASADPPTAKVPVPTFASAAGSTPGPARMARPTRVLPDRAVVPTSLRRASNAVLLAVALLAAAMAVVAGLTLVRQRSDDTLPAPSEQVSNPSSNPSELAGPR